MTYSPELCLTLYPNAKGKGYVISESPKELVNYGVSKVRPIHKDFIKRLQKFLTQYRPTLIILRDYNPQDYRISKRIKKVLNNFKDLAQQNDIPVHSYNREQIKEVFEMFGKTNKYGISKSIANFYPELQHRMPNLRKNCDSEHYQMAVFDAFSLMLTHYYIK